jgi:hypothetical protein
MTSAEGITKLGFRRWYERQLIESHAYLVTGFMSLILAVACMEEFSARGPAAKVLLMTALMAGAAVLCWAALKRYRFVLEHAERVAEQSVCGQCGVYGGLRVLAPQPGGAVPGTGSRGELLTVACRKCGHQWTMDCGAGEV